MSDLKYGGTRTVLWLALLSLFLGLALLPATCFATDVNVTMFGPKQYLRTTNSVDIYTDTFRAVPGNGTVTIQNGDGNGHKLVGDVLISINGAPLLDWSLLMQPGYKLQDPIALKDENEILVIILGKAGGYITIRFDAEITPDATTTQVIGIDGGTVSVQNHLGDTFTLQVPPLALGQDTAISVSALPNALPSPIANSVFPGVALEPEGMLFSLPVTMTVALHGTLEGSNPAMLFWYQDPGDVLPIGNQVTTQNSVSGQNFHFSIEVAGAPTVGELLNTLRAIANGPGSDLDKAQGVLTIAGDLQSLGDDADAASAWTAAQNFAANAANAELKTALPPDPCGQEATAHNLQLAGELQRLDLAALASKIMARDCTLALKPDSIQLYVGQTASIEATLRDPKGNTWPCSTQWFDSDPGVASIAPSGNNCATAGVALGASIVSARCDGVNSFNTPSSNDTTVTVCSLAGTFQGPYSGHTTTHEGKRKDFSGTVTLTFSQNGTNVSTDFDGYPFAGTNISGSVTLAGKVYCNGGKSKCAAGANGNLSADCLTFSGSFYDYRPRTITGEFSLHRIGQ